MAQGIEHVPTKDTKELVKNLSAVGTRHIDIAHKLHISDDTLRKHYKAELDDGRIDANASIAGTLYKQAKAGNTTAMIFWLKTRAGWKETNVTELSAGDGEDVSGIKILLVEADGNKD